MSRPPLPVPLALTLLLALGACQSGGFSLSDAFSSSVGQTSRAPDSGPNADDEDDDDDDESSSESS